MCLFNFIPFKLKLFPSFYQFKCQTQVIYAKEMIKRVIVYMYIFNVFINLSVGKSPFCLNGSIKKTQNLFILFCYSSKPSVMHDLH